jgi:hypothetical protein
MAKNILDAMTNVAKENNSASDSHWIFEQPYTLLLAKGTGLLITTWTQLSYR